MCSDWTARVTRAAGGLRPGVGPGREKLQRRAALLSHTAHADRAQCCRESWQLLGRELYRTEAPADYTGTTEIDYLPLHIGRVTLPGVIQRTTTWETAATPCHYSESTAQALALRACRAQLYMEFPDAIIEAERRGIDQGEDAAACTVTYIFCANIAEKP